MLIFLFLIFFFSKKDVKSLGKGSCLLTDQGGRTKKVKTSSKVDKREREWIIEVKKQKQKKKRECEILEDPHSNFSLEDFDEEKTKLRIPDIFVELLKTSLGVFKDIWVKNKKKIQTKESKLNNKIK